MKNEDVEIRNLSREDIKDIVRLNRELGYTCNLEDARKRMDIIIEDKNYKTLVAEINNRVIGYIGLCKMHAYEYDGDYIRIVSLIVCSNYRNRGIGTKLISEAERYAKEKGAIAITLNSGINRKEAHEFYKNNNYKIKGYGFAKKLK